MAFILEDYQITDYKIFYIHQTDTREFNRGAMKNIGFLYIKNKYPNTYQNITIVFNDVDTMPFTKNFLNYETTIGVVKHFYGYTFTLGGIVSIKASDFERINGFPNLWSWGFEDNDLQRRVLDANITIDRSQYFPIMDKNILQLKDGLTRVVNRNEFDRYLSNTKEGFNSITNLSYHIDETTNFVNVLTFQTGIQETPSENKIYDLRKGNSPFTTDIYNMQNMKRPKPKMKMAFHFH
jgi:hypothetical protein